MDETIIFRIKSGDLMVLDKIYLEIKPKFIAYARRQFPNVQLEDVQDIYQDSIIVFYQNIRRGVLTEITSNLSSYIIQIGKIKLIQHTNKFNKYVDLQMNFADPFSKDEEYDNKIDQAVKFIFSKMTDSCKQILNLFYYEKKSMEEIAFVLNYKNADTVKSKKSRCISTFNSNVNKIYFDEE
jgi:RNA polymerase sigma-70 factor (ECF subfamily)